MKPCVPAAGDCSWTFLTNSQKVRAREPDRFYDSVSARTKSAGRTGRGTDGTTGFLWTNREFLRFPVSQGQPGGHPGGQPGEHSVVVVVAAAVVVVTAVVVVVVVGVVSSTVTSNDAFAVFPELSVAEQSTVVVPIENSEPEGGEHTGVTGPSTASVAEMAKVTVAPAGPVASRTRSGVEPNTGAVVSSGGVVVVADVVVVVGCVVDVVAVVGAVVDGGCVVGVPGELEVGDPTVVTVVEGDVVVVVDGGNVALVEEATVVGVANGPARVVVVVDGETTRPATSTGSDVSTETAASPSSPPPSGYMASICWVDASERPMNQLTPMVTAKAKPPANATMMRPEMRRPTKTLLRSESVGPGLASSEADRRSAICLARSSGLSRSRRFGWGNRRSFPHPERPELVGTLSRI